MRAKIITILFFALPMLLCAQGPKPIPTKNISVNGVVFKMVKVESGSFQMGATTEQGSTAKSDEKPAHMVTLKSYYIAETPVTQELWQSIMVRNSVFPPRPNGSSPPVEAISQKAINMPVAPTPTKWRGIPRYLPWNCRL